MANDSENKIQAYDKKGYLHQGFRIFRLQDSSMEDIPFHYHDFHKIIFFLKGEAAYIIEGKTYPLTARDILFVRAGEIHKPVTYPDKTYQRIVVYISPLYLQKLGQGKYPLEQCFDKSQHMDSVMPLPAVVTTCFFIWTNWKGLVNSRTLPTSYIPRYYLRS